MTPKKIHTFNKQILNKLYKLIDREGINFCHYKIEGEVSSFKFAKDGDLFEITVDNNKYEDNNE